MYPESTPKYDPQEVIDRMSIGELRAHLCGNSKGSPSYCLSCCHKPGRCPYGKRLLELQGRLKPEPVEKKPAKSGRGFSAEERKKAANALKEKGHHRALEAVRHDDPVQWLIDNPGNSKVAKASHSTAASQWSRYLSKFPDVKQAWEERKKNAPVPAKPVEAEKDDFIEVIVKIKGQFGTYTLSDVGSFVIQQLPGDMLGKSITPINSSRAIPMLEEWLKAAKRLLG